MSRKYSITLSRNQLVLGIVGALIFVSGTAYGISVGNTPDTGYLLCANQKTRALTYPGKLSCPTGTTSLALGAQGPAGQDGSDGASGPQGPAGPTGPAGASSNSIMWNYHFGPFDIVGPGKQSSFSSLRKFILADISSKNLNGGFNYDLRADISGLWASNSATNSYMDCYFQAANAYPSGGTYFGAASATYNSWTGIELVVHGEPSDYSLSQSDVYLVCATDGMVSGIQGLLTASSYNLIKPMALSAPPAS